ncbi:MAG: hypothetical protein JWQ83_2023, partial [Lacunisphaera sp.]|nr:hypothetical protein [Lacunisphaera sp.]
DLVLTKNVLYQLSYLGRPSHWQKTKRTTKKRFLK